MSNFLSPETKLKTRDKVLKSALILFVEKGFFNTSISDLVKHSGVSSGSIYHSFKDKQQVAEALMNDLIKHIESNQQIIFNSYSSSWDRYYHLCEWLLTSAENNPHMVQFVLKAQHQEYMPDTPPICSSQPFLNLREVIQQAINNEELRNMDLMLAASIAFGGVLRLIQLRLDGLIDEPATNYLEELTLTSWTALMKPIVKPRIKPKKLKKT